MRLEFLALAKLPVNKGELPMDNAGLKTRADGTAEAARETADFKNRLAVAGSSQRGLFSRGSA
jgi:hypothetical protein